jgi:inner membrane protein
MIYKTHIAFALAPALYIEGSNDNMTFAVELLFYLSVAIGSLAPDLDEERSKISKILPIFPWIYKIFGIGHRGFTHQLLFVMILSGFFWYILKYQNIDYLVGISIFGFILGYFMHLVGDMLTKAGINNFLYPFFGIRGVLLPRMFRFYTSSKEEKIIFYLLIFFIIYQISIRISPYLNQI